VVKKINQLITFILGTKLMIWAVPDSKRFIKGIGTTAVIVLVVIYFHAEYLSWAEISGSTTYLSISYIIKNLIILISLIILFIYLKKTKKKAYIKKVKDEEMIYTKGSDDRYFDRFRGKKLRTKSEQILDKSEKN
jgi:predicted membrane protein